MRRFVSFCIAIVIALLLANCATPKVALDLSLLDPPKNCLCTNWVEINDWKQYGKTDTLRISLSRFYAIVNEEAHLLVINDNKASWIGGGVVIDIPTKTLTLYETVPEWKPIAVLNTEQLLCEK